MYTVVMLWLCQISIRIIAVFLTIFSCVGTAYSDTSILSDHESVPHLGVHNLSVLQLDAAPTRSDDIKRPNIDDSRDAIVTRLRLLSKQIDSFFLDRFFGEQITSDDDFDGSRAKLAIITEHRPRQLLDVRVRLNVRLVLPNTNERLSLLLEADDDQSDGIINSDSKESDGLNAAFRFILREKDRWRTNLDAGIRSGLPPKVFIRVRSQRTLLVDDWNLRFRQTIGYFSHEGPASKTEFRVDYLFNRFQFVRFNNSAHYLFDDQLFEFDHQLQLFRELDKKNAIAVGLSVEGDSSKDTKYYQYQLEFKLRRQIYNTWLFLEVAPALEWVEDNDFKTMPLITFKLEAIFDNY